MVAPGPRASGLPPPKKDGKPRTILQAFGDKRAAAITLKDVGAYVESRLAEGAAPATANREVQLLGQALRLAVENKRLVSALKIPRQSEKANVRKGFFERAEFDAVAQALPDDLRDIAEFAYVTSWRRGEILSLRWSDVDREGGEIRLRPEESKNGEGRDVALEGDVKAVIDRRWRGREYQTPSGETALSELVFHRAGNPIVDFRKSWASACKAAGVVGRLFHDLRRSGIRNMVRAGVRESVAMEISGHRTRSVFDRYNITSKKDVREALRKAAQYRKRQPTGSNVRSLKARAV